MGMKEDDWLNKRGSYSSKESKPLGTSRFGEIAPLLLTRLRSGQDASTVLGTEVLTFHGRHGTDQS